jgi:hypothetical protein
MRNVRGIFVASVLLLAGAVSAEPAGDGATDKVETKVLTDKEKAEDGLKQITEMKVALSAVVKLVSDARNDRDPLRLNCVNERKAQIESILKVAELALEDVKAALQERQSEAADHEYEKITLSRSKVDKIDAEQCIGSLAFYDSDKVERDFKVPGDLTTLDVIVPESVGSPYFRPAPASPVR